VSWTQFRLINGVAVVILLAVAIAALLAPAASHRPSLRMVMLALCWVTTVAFVMHATVDVALRLLSLNGLLTIEYPFWVSIDQRQADLQDLLFNEPWFLVEGLLWGAIAWCGGLNRSPERGWWIACAVVAILGLTVVGLLSAAGVIGKIVVG
jgi:hypothetical protein